jgi:dihydropyrimidinase
VSAASLLSQGRGSLFYFPESRPVISEVVATQRAIAMCEATGSPVYLVHLSCERALRQSDDARSRGLPVYVETRPLYLHLTQERYRGPDGPLFVAQPPLRGARDVEALWAGLANGGIDVIASDHAPWTREEKLLPELNVAHHLPGVANLEVMLPMLFSEGVRKGRITVERFVALSSTNAARLFGLYPRKGEIAPGSDADIAVWDPNERRTIHGSELPSRAGHSVYEGMEVVGWPQVVVRRGEVVFRKGKTSGRPGSGQVMRCGPTQPLP